jgi:hypothetical protein
VKHIALTALVALSLAACGRNPLRVPGAVDAPLPVGTTTQTSPTVPTMTQADCVESGCYWMASQCICIIGTETATATATATATPASTSTATATATSTEVDASVDDSTATKTATTTSTVTAVFKILSVSVDKVDALGNPSEDVRSFGIQFTSPAKDVDLTIATKDTGVFHQEQVNGVISGSLYISPGNWTERLKPNTTYQWSVTANAATEVVGSLSDVVYGEFTTALCFVGATVDIGNGVAPSIAGSNSGFGIVWKDNTHMPAEMDKGMFNIVDRTGNKLVNDYDFLSTDDIANTTFGISSMAGNYMVTSNYASFSHFDMFGINGGLTGYLNNQPKTQPIAGSNNEAFTFLDHGEGFPALHKVQITTNGAVDEKVFQWGPQAAFKTTVGAQTGGTWAFGMAQVGQVMVVVIKDGGVYPNVVNPIDAATGSFVYLDAIVLDSIVATDSGYVLAWWYTAPGTNWLHYLSFVPYDGEPDGIVKKTIEVMGWTGSNSGARRDRLAWNGKYVGLLAANPVVGETNLLLFRNDGTQVGDKITIFSSAEGQQKQSPADLAASGNVFGIVSTSSAENAARFTPVDCQ